jgi:hypothetical protein
MSRLLEGIGVAKLQQGLGAQYIDSAMTTGQSLPAASQVFHQWFWHDDFCSTITEGCQQLAQSHQEFPASWQPPCLFNPEEIRSTITERCQQQNVATSALPDTWANPLPIRPC